MLHKSFNIFKAILLHTEFVLFKMTKCLKTCDHIFALIFNKNDQLTASQISLYLQYSDASTQSLKCIQYIQHEEEREKERKCKGSRGKGKRDNLFVVLKSSHSTLSLESMTTTTTAADNNQTQFKWEIAHLANIVKRMKRERNML